MNAVEYAKLLQYIKENNSWGANMYVIQYELHRRVVKYVDASFDTRTGRIWKINFRSCLGGGERERAFDINSPEDVNKIYKWLDEHIGGN